MEQVSSLKGDYNGFTKDLTQCFATPPSQPPATFASPKQHFVCIVSNCQSICGSNGTKDSLKLECWNLRSGWSEGATFNVRIRHNGPKRDTLFQIKDLIVKTGSVCNNRDEGVGYKHEATLGISPDFTDETTTVYSSET